MRHTFKYRSLTPEEASTKPDFCCAIDDGQPRLKKHKYFAQVQGQMAIGREQWCDFIIYTEKGLSVERIPFSEEFWVGETLPKLVEFFECTINELLSHTYQPLGICTLRTSSQISSMTRLEQVMRGIKSQFAKGNPGRRQRLPITPELP